MPRIDVMMLEIREGGWGGAEGGMPVCSAHITDISAAVLLKLKSIGAEEKLVCATQSLRKL